MLERWERMIVHVSGTQDIGSEIDSGPRAHERERLCVVTRTVRPVADLIRFVIGPDGEVVADLKRRLPGRGVWVTGTREALNEAVKRKSFSRGFRRDVRLPADFVVRTEHLLERAANDALAVASKAGLVIAGFARVKAGLEQGEVVALLHAAEASADGIRKLEAVSRQTGADRPLIRIGFLTAAQLDLALNRPNVIHAALLAGSASETFLARCRRVERFRTGDQHMQAGMMAPEVPAEDV